MSYTFNLPADQLIAALAATLPHCQKAVTTDTRAVALKSVRFDTVDGKLVLVATDRYSLGIYEPEKAEVGEGFEPLSIDQVDAKRLLTMVKGVGKQALALPVWFTVTHESSLRLVEVKTLAGSMSFHDGGDNFPAWRMLARGIIDKATGLADTESTGAFNPAALAKFESACELIGKVREPLKIMLGAHNKPAVVLATNFVGVIMPVRGDIELNDLARRIGHVTELAAVERVA